MIACTPAREVLWKMRTNSALSQFAIAAMLSFTCPYCTHSRHGATHHKSVICNVQIANTKLDAPGF
jgi:hypothetical protein